MKAKDLHIGTVCRWRRWSDFDVDVIVIDRPGRWSMVETRVAGEDRFFENKTSDPKTVLVAQKIELAGSPDNWRPRVVPINRLFTVADSDRRREELEAEKKARSEEWRATLNKVSEVGEWFDMTFGVDHEKVSSFFSGNSTVGVEVKMTFEQVKKLIELVEKGRKIK